MLGFFVCFCGVLKSDVSSFSKVPVDRSFSLDLLFRVLGSLEYANKADDAARFPILADDAVTDLDAGDPAGPTAAPGPAIAKDATAGTDDDDADAAGSSKSRRRRAESVFCCLFLFIDLMMDLSNKQKCSTGWSGR